MSISSADTGDVCMKSPESLRGAGADRFDLVTLWEESGFALLPCLYCSPLCFASQSSCHIL